MALSVGPPPDGLCVCSGQDNNTFAPGTVNVAWEDLGTIEEVQNE